MLVLSLGTPAPAAAQEEEVLRVRRVAEPYDIRAAIVQSGLSLGKTLFAITIVDSAEAKPLPDVKVTLRAEHQESGHELITTAHNTPRSPDQYNAQMTLDEPGFWRMMVEVESSAGLAAVQLAKLDVPATRRISGGTFVFIGVFAALIAGVAYLWWSTVRRSRKLRNDPSAPGPTDA